MRKVEPKLRCRIYLTADEYEHLKSVAEENGTSFTDLVTTAALKKYPLPKKRKARSVNLASTVANDISSEVSEQEPQQTPIPEKTESPVVDVVPKGAELNKEKEARLREVNRLLNLAKKGERLERDVYFALIEEQKELRALLGHN